MIKVTLKAVSFHPENQDLSVAYLQTDAGKILPLQMTRLVALNFLIPKDMSQFSVYYPILSVSKALGASIDHFILGVNEKEEDIHRSTRIVFYKLEDILREKPISALAGIEMAIGMHYFFDIPLYIDDSLVSILIEEDELSDELRSTINSSDKILNI